MYVGFCDVTLRHIHTYIAYIMYSSWAELSLAVWGSVLYVPSNCCPLCAVLLFSLSRQLLIDCGFRSGGGSEEDSASCSAVSQHRALVFCQLKSMLDILENDLLR